MHYSLLNIKNDADPRNYTRILARDQGIADSPVLVVVMMLVLGLRVVIAVVLLLVLVIILIQCTYVMLENNAAHLIAVHYSSV